MCPILLFQPRITSYGALLGLALLLGWWLARRRAGRVGIPLWHIDWLVPLLLMGAALGARAAGALLQMVAGGNNDRVVFGGLLLAIAVAAVYARAVRVPLGRLCDAFAYALPAGVGLLRVGCFLGGCCWGTICDGGPFRVTFPTDSPAYLQQRLAGSLGPDAERSLPVHPVQLYEAAGAAVVLGLLIVLDGRMRHAGASFLVSVVGFAAVRFVGDGFRADVGAVAWGLTAGQWGSLALAAACLVAWKRRGALPRPDTVAQSGGQKGWPSSPRFPI